MARFYQPKQRESNKRWDFTCSSDEEGWCHPVGYCRGWTDPDDSDKLADQKGWPKMSETERERMLEHRNKFHTDGHDSPTEASRCYRGYQLDFEQRKLSYSNEMHKCIECGEWTKDVIEVGQFHHFHLCEKHQGRPILEKLLTPKEKN